MEIVKGQEQLVNFEMVSYPKMSARDRKDVYKRVRNIAIPIELNNQEVLSTEDAAKKIRKLMNG
ncbi:MAG: hypothetical protein HRT70_08895 [Flavobacteriaceae bacterium]|nr:hypothetical protein [Flavobacteriaceae bacterium]